MVCSVVWFRCVVVMMCWLLMWCVRFGWSVWGRWLIWLISNVFFEVVVSCVVIVVRLVVFVFSVISGVFVCVEF